MPVFASDLLTAVESLMQQHHLPGLLLAAARGADAPVLAAIGPVSYTHLDVYKRQGIE